MLEVWTHETEGWLQFIFCLDLHGVPLALLRFQPIGYHVCELLLDILVEVADEVLLFALVLLFFQAVEVISLSLEPPCKVQYILISINQVGYYVFTLA